MFGLIADRFGRRAMLLTLGAALMPLTFAILGLTHWSLWISTALMGLSFSVIPAVHLAVDRHAGRARSPRKPPSG